MEFSFNLLGAVFLYSNTFRKLFFYINISSQSYDCICKRISKIDLNIRTCCSMLIPNQSYDSICKGISKKKSNRFKDRVCSSLLNHNLSLRRMRFLCFCTNYFLLICILNYTQQMALKDFGNYFMPSHLLISEIKIDIQTIPDF